MIDDLILLICLPRRLPHYTLPQEQEGTEVWRREEASTKVSENLLGVSQVSLSHAEMAEWTQCELVLQSLFTLPDVRIACLSSAPPDTGAALLFPLDTGEQLSMPLPGLPGEPRGRATAHIALFPFHLSFSSRIICLWTRPYVNLYLLSPFRISWISLTFNIPQKITSQTHLTPCFNN